MPTWAVISNRRRTAGLAWHTVMRPRSHGALLRWDVRLSCESPLNPCLADGRELRHLRECATLRDGLAGWGCNNADDVVLVFSELVTNATLHATGRSRTVIAHGPPHLQLDVHDVSHSIPELRLDTRYGGSGLRIVSQLNHNWGWDQTVTGKVVWSIIACGH